jgi:hypothetical protein
MWKKLKEICRGVLSTWRACDNSDSVFESLLDMAKKVDLIDPRGLHALVVAILRPLQSEQILGAAERPQHAASEGLDVETFFMGADGASWFSFSQLAVINTKDFEVDLARDITLPTLWHRQSVASAFAAIGTGLKSGPWRQDGNHLVCLCLPWRIAFVNGGNHSIAAGILSAEGVVKSSSVYDLTPLLKVIYCDGFNYRKVSDGSVIAVVDDERIAAVWEIGRIMARLDRAS